MKGAVMAQLIRDVMTPDVEVIHPSDSLHEAAEKMRSVNVGALPVCDEERVQGILTDRDIVVRAIAVGRDPASTTVGDIMTAGVAYCFDDDTLEHVLERMRAKQLRRFIVVNHDKKLVGIVSLTEVAGDSLRSSEEGGALGDLAESLGAVH